jgi:hypothetical protein
MPSKGKNEKGLKHLDTEAGKAASANDMTGLIPANPQLSDAPYAELIPIGPKKKK